MTTSSNPRILCVDDRREALVVRKALLEQFGCDVVVAYDPDQALRKVAEQDIDLAIVDYHLAWGAQGDDLAKDLRSVRPQMALIMLTGDPALPDEAKATVDAVLIKGVSNPSELLATIQKLLPEANLHQPRSGSAKTQR